MTFESRISMRTNFPEVARALDKVADDVGNKAMARALNTTIEQGRREMVRAITRKYRLTRAKVDERLHVRRAVVKGAFNLSARLEASAPESDRGMNLIAFVSDAAVARAGAAGRGKGKRKRAELKFQIKRGGGLKTIPGAFVGNEGRTVFIRQGPDRKPIEGVYTLSIPRMFNARDVNTAVRKVMLERFHINFKRELRGVLKGYVK